MHGHRAPALLSVALVVAGLTALRPSYVRGRGKTYRPKGMGTHYTPMGRKWRKEKPRRKLPLVRLEAGPGFVVGRPERAWGTRLAVYHINRVMALYRRRFPRAAPVIILDLSRRGGGVLDNHNSHVDGRDVDIPLVLDDVGDVEVNAPRSVNLHRTWFLVKAFADSCDIEYMFLDRKVQEQLHAHARKAGVPAQDLSLLLQFPADVTKRKGVVRHWPNHVDHVHVRFRHERAPLKPTVKAYCDWKHRKSR